MPKDKSGNVIAVYYAYGEILDAPGSSTEDCIDVQKMCKGLRKLRDNDDVKAVVLRVNSPGGSAYGSDQIWREVVRLKEKKPVIVSMGELMLHQEAITFPALQTAFSLTRLR